VAGSGDHIKALVRSHAAGDDASFYAVVSQIAAQAARQGHKRLAQDIKRTIEAARGEPAREQRVTPLAKPRGDLADLVTASYPKVRMRDLVGPEVLLEQITRVISEQRQRKTLTERGFDPAHRLLLEGPPGTGKTMTAAVIAHELSLPLLTVRLESLLSKYLGETGAKLRTVFEAVAQQRAVYLFDEFDALGGHRGGNDVGEARRILNSFLVFLEQASANSVVIASTNHRTILDQALFRRFDAVIEYDLPDRRQAVAVLKARLGRHARGIRWRSFKCDLTGLSHAELVKAAEAAAKQALMRGDEVVSNDDLTRAIAMRRKAGVGR
jgi:SpoVK/Ycf46/Vps4 family AAA+-type ATPase